MGAISKDLSVTGMAAAVEASWTGVFEQWTRSQRVELHDEARDLRWYDTPGVPFPLVNHAYFTRLAQEEDIDARIGEVVGGFAELGVPFMWSVGPFSQPADLGERLEGCGLSRAEELPGMAVDLRAINEDVSSPSALAVERVGDEEALRECSEVQRVGFEMPEFTSEVLFEGCTAVGLGEESPWRFYVGRLDGEAVAASALALAGGLRASTTSPRCLRPGGRAWARR